MSVESAAGQPILVPGGMSGTGVVVDDRWLTCRDGVRLASRLWRPAGPGPWPALLMRQPYGRAIASTVTYAHPAWYAARGFLVVVQDVRGRGDSEGQFGGFAQEAADGADAVAWTRRLEHCNGRVGCYGFSYQGLCQLLNDGGAAGGGSGIGGAAPDPACLPDALAPAMAGLDERDHWAGEGGAHWWALGLAWGLQLAAQGCRRRGDGAGWARIRRSLERGDFLEEGPALLAQFDPQGMASTWLASDPADGRGWRRHDPPEALLRRPLLLIGGWFDPHLRGVLNLWQRSVEAGGDPELVVGPWTHLDWRGSVDRLQLRFFRRHLDAPGGIPAQPASPPPPLPRLLPPRSRCRLYELGSGRWRRRDPGQAQGPSWGLASDGRAAIHSGEGRLLEPAAAGGQVWFVHDPWRPVPGRGGHLGLDPGPVERGDLDRRGDVACFSTAPLAEALVLQGIPELELELELDAPSGDLCGALSRLGADGRVEQLSTGVRRLTRGGQAGEPSGDGPLGRRRIGLRFQPLLLRLTAGERLRLSLAASAWPQIAVNPGDGSPPAGGPTAAHRPISVALHLAGSRLRLRPLASARLPAADALP